MTAFTNDHFIKNLSDLIAIPSVKCNPEDRAPYGIHTAKALEYVLNLAESLDLKTKNLNNKVGYIEWGTGKKIVAVLCHLDVVPAGKDWTVPPFQLTDKDQYLWGRGIVDNKGPAMCALYALLRLKESGFNPHCRIRIILGLDEESGSSCMTHYKKFEKMPDIGFTPDADFPVIYAEKGILQLRITNKISSSNNCIVNAGEAPNVVPSSCSLYHFNTDTHFSVEGRSAHASTPHKGENAIIKLVRSLPEYIIAEDNLLTFINNHLATLPDTQSLIHNIDDDESGKLTINPAQLIINENDNYLILDIRYPVHTEYKLLLQNINDKCSKYGFDFEIISHLPPLFLDKNSEHIRILMSVYRKYLNKFFRENSDNDDYACANTPPIHPLAIGGGTYARSMKNIVAFGPSTPWGLNTIHQKNERYLKNDMFILIDLYKDAIEALCRLYDK